LLTFIVRTLADAPLGTVSVALTILPVAALITSSGITIAPDVDVPALVGEVCARPDEPAAPPEDDDEEDAPEAGLPELAEPDEVPDEAPAGALAEAGLLAEPATPLDCPASPPPPPHALRMTLLTNRNIETLSSFIIFYSERKR
jgi:hypothetical protein